MKTMKTIYLEGGVLFKFKNSTFTEIQLKVIA